MSDDTGRIVKLKSHIVIEVLLVVALAAYFALAESRIVGADMTFTAFGAALMALVTFWTLNTVGDVIEVVAAWVRAERHG
ncbi:hypothetical protein EZI54_14675 [Marinobacter halodurans]|uniref:Chlorhexidine efflux transporter domain-containing protein n=1 Tax=Marinobacter halodurans TaxID=2528979 RepID=A0ABY1ZJV7_9GAMM|nr:hypothetical protein [Marinobacter halodurans]TBW53737.1 hypothetical protein EZI54_14675 [Marinobacter halodurans]